MTEYVRTVADEELVRSIKHNDVTGVVNILTHQFQNINTNYFDVTDDRSKTPLIYAIGRNANHRIVSSLLQHGADPNITDSSGRPALHYACDHKNSYVIELLIQFNANVNCQDADGWTPLFLLVAYLHTIYMDHEECIPCVRLLLDNNANVNIQNNYGRSCVFKVIEKSGPNKFDLLRLLLNSNFNINYQIQTIYMLKVIQYYIVLLEK